MKLVDVDELVVGAENRHARPTEHVDGGAPGRCENAKLRRAERRAGLEQGIAFLEVFAPRPDVAPRVARVADLYGLGAAIGVLDPYDGIGAVRYRGARHDANGLAGSHRTRREPPRSDGLEDAKDYRSLGRGRFE